MQRVVVVKDKYNKKAHEESAQLACEAAGAIRTVASLTRERDCLHMYSRSLEKPLQVSNKTAVWSNMMYAFAQSVAFWVIALVFWFGAGLVAELEITSTQFFVGLMVCFKHILVLCSSNDCSTHRAQPLLLSKLAIYSSMLLI